jgi:clan AA aspartic protease
VISGSVSSDREAVVALRLIGRDTDVIVDAVIDTGFTDYLTLPLETIDLLQFPLDLYTRVTLADGSQVRLAIHTATLMWDGSIRQLPVIASEGGALIGTNLLYGSDLFIRFVDGGDVVIKSIPLSD